MSDLAEVFAAAQEAALRGSVALATAMELQAPRIYSVVPANAPLPYVVIGEDLVREEDLGCGVAGEIRAAVHVWARPDPPSSALARRIAGVVGDILGAAFAIEGHVIDEWSAEDAAFNTDPDGSTHGRLAFTYLTTQSGA